MFPDSGAMPEVEKTNSPPACAYESGSSKIEDEVIRKNG